MAIATAYRDTPHHRGKRYEGARQTEPQVVVRKVESIALFTLSETEKAALHALPLHVAIFETGQDLVRECDRPSQCFAVLDGFVSVYKTTRSGKRQVMAFHVPRVTCLTSRACI